VIGATRVRQPRSGAILAAVWLIGLGLIFIIHDAANMTWGEAWPMFVILVGVASLTSRALGRRRLWSGAWSLVWPLAWIVVGVVLLLSTTGTIAIGVTDLIATWWPVLLIGIGVWFLVAAVWPGQAAPNEHLAIPLAGATHGSIRVRFGAGDLRIAPGIPGTLVSGSFTGGVVYTGGTGGAVDLQPYTEGGWPNWWDRRLRWDVGLPREIPIDLRVESGAASSTIDLTDLQVRTLELQTGASDSRVLLPRAAGATTMRARSGAASLTIQVPVGVGARVRSRMTVGSTVVDPVRFPRTIDGYESPDYATAQNRVDIDIEGGVGSLRIS